MGAKVKEMQPTFDAVRVRISEQNTKFYLRIFVEMPGHGVADAFYGGIIGITYSVSRHPLLS